MYSLHYRKIPSVWTDGLPIGNGRLAAMYWGDAQTDIFSLNHEHLWRGKYRGKEAPQVADKLPELRRFLKERDYFRASLYANLYFAGLAGCSGVGEGRIDPYQPAGNLVFRHSQPAESCESGLTLDTGYLRALRDGDLSTEAFCDANDGCVLTRWKAEKPFSGTLQWEREQDPEATCETAYTPEGIAFTCTFLCGISYRVAVTLATDGVLQPSEHGLQISDATVLTCSTNIVLTQTDDRPANLAFDALLEAHSSRFASYMHRVQFHLEAPASQDDTETRLERMRCGGDDNGMLELYFHYGRYLMISSCICGKLPPNLQGKWDLDLNPPWRSDYHFDINLQMNEWMLEGSNLSEFAEPLADFLLTFIPNGRIAAKNLYGCRGIWMTHQADVWAESTPESFGYAVWVGSAAWAAQPLWQHYLYTGDKDFLRNKAYVFFKEVALFFEDFLEADENGILQIMPSQSPENRFVGAARAATVGICSSSAIDVQLTYDALGYAINSAEILGVDADCAAKWKEMRSKLPPFAIGSDGRLLEWNEEFQEEQPGHKHLSHLYGLFPSDIFTPGSRPEAYAAAVKAFRYRLAHQSGYTGWSRAWIANILARIGDPENFYVHMHDLLQTFATNSLLDTHPDPVNKGGVIFQIDGNFGMVSAVTEALCSCFDGKVHLLHALPSVWPNGHLDGIKLPGGHTIGFSWENGQLKQGTLIMGFAETVVLSYCGRELQLSGTEGTVIPFGPF